MKPLLLRVAPWLLLATVGIAAGIMFRNLFPKTVTVITPPRIRTQYDTVRVLDTLWQTRLVRETQWDTVYLERVITAAPETLRVCPELRGLTTLAVGEKVGDSTVAQGFQLTRADSSVLLTRWQTQWWTAGPLRALSLDTFPPRADFWPAPKQVKGCGFLCALGHYVTGAAAGASVCELGHLLKP